MLKTLETFDLTPHPSINKALVRELMTGAMLDRLTHRVHILEANGESYRLRDNQRPMRRRRTATSKN